jgi:hypothetical protein
VLRTLVLSPRVPEGKHGSLSVGMEPASRTVIYLCEEIAERAESCDIMSLTMMFNSTFAPLEVC